MQELSGSEQTSSWMAVTAAAIALLLTAVFAYAFFGSHIDYVTPDFMTDRSAIHSPERI
jgi:hypothetical protein